MLVIILYQKHLLPCSMIVPRKESVKSRKLCEIEKKSCEIAVKPDLSVIQVLIHNLLGYHS